MIINETTFNVDCMTILKELQQQLQINKISLLQVIQDSSEDVMIACPYHKDGQENRPSMGVRKHDGLAHCFACNTVVTLPQLISHCFGDDSEIGATGWNWLLKNFLTVSVEERKDIELDFSRVRDINVLHHSNSIRSGGGNDDRFVSEEELDSYRWMHPYWAKRKITDERIIELFDLGYDPGSKCITMPVRDIKGNCLFVARRSVNSKWFNYPKSSVKPVFGLYELAQQPKYPNEVLICESMIDAITVWQYGKYAVALNGLGTAYQFKQLRQMPCRKFILATDADGPGMAARANIKRNVPNKLITEYIWDLTIAKDINDMTEEYFNSLKDTL